MNKEVTTQKCLLQADKITKRYGGVVALKEAQFSAEEGEVHALLGENGAGKSTFIKALTGAIQPDEGSIVIGGEQFDRISPAEAKERGVASVFQELSLVPDFTGAENIWFEQAPLSRLGTVSSRRMVRDSEALLKQLNFPMIPLDRPVVELTVAQRQLIEIVKAVRANPRILILDEATSALAPEEAELVMEMTRRIAAKGSLCIFISHRLGEVRAVADRLTIFRNGETVGSYATDEVTDDEVIAKIIGRRMETLYPPSGGRTPGEELLRCTNLSGGHRLHDADLTLNRGEILGIGGLQGQGQLELFLRLFGVLHGGGEIFVKGKKTKIRSPRAALGAGIGFALIPEDRKNDGLLLTKSVQENISLPRLGEVTRLGLVRRALEQRLARSVIGNLSIALDNPDQNVNTLSGGNQQKVVIGKFLYPEIEILLCYDPTRGVDVGAKHDIFQLLQDQAAAGRGVLYFSTDIQELIHVPDRVAVVAGGRVTAMLVRDQLTDEAVLKASLAVSEEVSV